MSTRKYFEQKKWHQDFRNGTLVVYDFLTPEDIKAGLAIGHESVDAKMEKFRTLLHGVVHVMEKTLGAQIRVYFMFSEDAVKFKLQIT